MDKNLKLLIGRNARLKRLELKLVTRIKELNKEGSEEAFLIVSRLRNELETLQRKSELVDSSIQSLLDKKVTVRRVALEMNGKLREYHVVNEELANPAFGYVSFNSPIGKAIVALEKGAKDINVDTPGGIKSYKVLSAN